LFEKKESGRNKKTFISDKNNTDYSLQNAVILFNIKIIFFSKKFHRMRFVALLQL
jgi:hypothetical protein